jgi:O-acetylhomoserine (thiol)-lyase
LTLDEQLAAGVTPGYVRLSIGLEHPDDILEDLSQALDAAGRVSVHEPSRKAA